MGNIPEMTSLQHMNYLQKKLRSLSRTNSFTRFVMQKQIRKRSTVSLDH